MRQSEYDFIQICRRNSMIRYLNRFRQGKEIAPLGYDEHRILSGIKMSNTNSLSLSREGVIIESKIPDDGGPVNLGELSEAIKNSGPRGWDKVTT